MPEVLTASAVAISDAYVAAGYNDLDDLKSIRRWLYRAIPEVYIYIEPIEGMFERPALTVRPADQGLAEGGQGAFAHTYNVEHSIIITAYGLDRAATIELGQRVWRLLHEGAGDGAAYRLPMWSFALNAALARKLRVVAPSLAMSLEETDDEGKWSRPIELRVQSPRSRPTRRAPLVERVTITTTGT
jgi:hypothetical protein